MIGSSRPVGIADKGKLPHVEATLLELQRISNTCNLLINLYNPFNTTLYFISEQVIGSSRPVGIADKGKLPHVEATLLELQRISNTCGSKHEKTCLRGF